MYKLCDKHRSIEKNNKSLEENRKVNHKHWERLVPNRFAWWKSFDCLLRVFMKKMIDEKMNYWNVEMKVRENVMKSWLWLNCFAMKFWFVVEARWRYWALNKFMLFLASKCDVLRWIDVREYFDCSNMNMKIDEKLHLAKRIDRLFIFHISSRFIRWFDDEWTNKWR